ncbi:SAV_915 family protein [Streptomyces sp. NPDC058953]|uniref:SAV_915 family protein n=1 Tax=unclassified Streptomyces TaxID=2593676 RepID=UPI00368D2F9E
MDTLTRSRSRTRTRSRGGARSEEAADPDERTPSRPLYVPVRLGSSGGRQLRFLRTPLGARTAVGFTDPGKLSAAMGRDARWIQLAEPALRALAEPLGVTLLTVDPLLTAPFPAAGGRGAVPPPCVRRSGPALAGD